MTDTRNITAYQLVEFVVGAVVAIGAFTTSIRALVTELRAPRPQ